MRQLISIAALVLIAALVVACSGDTVLTLHPDALPAAAVGQPYNVEITQTTSSGETRAFDINAVGTLPPGLSVVNTPSAPHTITGTPTAAGSYPFRMDAGGGCTMAGCNRGQHEYVLVVAP